MLDMLFMFQKKIIKELEEKFEKLLSDREIKEQTKEEKQTILKRSERVASKIERDEKETRYIID